MSITEGPLDRPLRRAVSGVMQWPSRLHAGALIVVTVGISVLVFWPTLLTLSDAWLHVHDYQHGYLIAAISLGWLGVVTRGVWQQDAQPSLAGTALLAGTLLAWLIGFNANSQGIHQVLFPVAMWAALFAATGWTVARHAVAPMAFLYFAVPIWEFLLPVLQRMSVGATELILAVLAVPADVREYSVTIPEGTFAIVDGCSGKRYFIVTAAIAVLGGFITGLGKRRFVALVAASCVLALIANWLRIVVIIYAGHVTNMQHYFVAVEHSSLGNVIFGALMIGVALLVRRLSAGQTPAPTTASLSQAPRARFSVRLAAMPLGLLVATLITTQVRAGAEPAATALGDLPISTSTWQGPLPAVHNWMPEYHEPDAQRRAAYASSAGIVEIYVNAYAAQHQGRELILYRNTLLAPGAWDRPWPPITRVVESPAGPLAMFEARLNEDDAWIVAYTFEIGGWPTTFEGLAQLAYGVKSFLRPVPSGVVALASRCDQNCDAARALIASFWDDMSARFLALIPDERTNG